MCAGLGALVLVVFILEEDALVVVQVNHLQVFILISIFQVSVFLIYVLSC